MSSATPLFPGENRKLRIAYLLQKYREPTQTFVDSDIAALRADGHQVRIYTMKPGGKKYSLHIERGVLRPTFSGVLRWPLALWRLRAALPSTLRSIFRGFASSPRTALFALMCVPRAAEITEQITKHREEVVHLFWSRHVALVLALLKAGNSPGLRSVFVGAYDLVEDDLLVDMALASADIVFSHSEANRSFLESRAPAGTPIEIVYRGIPLTTLEDSLSRDADTWITASALVEEKNIESVIRAFAHVRARRPGLKLRIYGEGPERNRLEACCRSLGCWDAVRFEGHVERDTLFQAMQQADCFLMLSRKSSERLPNVIKEALWAGCAILSSQSEGIEELLPDEEIGRVVDQDDQAAVNRAAEELLERDRSRDPERRERARKLIRERFCAQTNMREYAQVWSTLLYADPKASIEKYNGLEVTAAAEASPHPSHSRASTHR